MSRSNIHPLFDPTSRFNRMRTSVSPEDKMRGYFLWEQTKLQLPVEEAERSRIVLSQEPTEDTRTAQDANAAATTPHFANAAASAPHLVYRLDRPDSPVAAVVQDEIFPGPDREMEIGLTFDLKEGLDFPRQIVGFLAFIVEQEVWQRLCAAEPSLPETPSPQGWACLWRAETLTSNLHVARILSALPEWEGSVDSEGHGSCTKRHPTAGQEELPSTAQIVVVLNHYGE